MIGRIATNRMMNSAEHSQGMLECPFCTYLLNGRNSAVKCPECGLQFDSRGKVFRGHLFTRRHSEGLRPSYRLTLAMTFIVMILIAGFLLAIGLRLWAAPFLCFCAVIAVLVLARCCLDPIRGIVVGPNGISTFCEGHPPQYCSWDNVTQIQYKYVCVLGPQCQSILSSSGVRLPIGRIMRVQLAFDQGDYVAEIRVQKALYDTHRMASSTEEDGHCILTPATKAGYMWLRDRICDVNWGLCFGSFTRAKGLYVAIGLASIVLCCGLQILGRFASTDPGRAVVDFLGSSLMAVIICCCGVLVQRKRGVAIGKDGIALFTLGKNLQYVHWCNVTDILYNRKRTRCRRITADDGRVLRPGRFVGTHVDQLTCVLGIDAYAPQTDCRTQRALEVS